MRMAPRPKCAWRVVACLVSGLFATIVLDLCHADLRISDCFFDPLDGLGPWIGTHSEPWRSLYLYGEAPALALVAGAACLLACSFFKDWARPYRRPCAVMVLTVILGPGLVVNGLLKPGWGRPRPADIARFGGESEYREVWRPQGPGAGKSFPCGHCAMAFAMCSAVSLRNLHPWIGVATALAGGCFGAFMSLARIAQGGHFVTDVLWSAVLVLALIVVLDCLLVAGSPRAPNTEAGPRDRGRNRLTALMRSSSPIVVILLFWLAAAAYVDPSGDFMVNDDWAFTRSLERLVHEGTLGDSTGWGPKNATGGPSLIVHLLWGALFAGVWGFSPTVLRVSTLCLGAAGSVALYFLARTLGARVGAAMIAVAVLALNPLYFSQSFTFMSDVPFTFWVILSLLFLFQGVLKGSSVKVCVGLALSLAAVLVRQIGLVIPLAFAAVSLLRPGIASLWGRGPALPALAATIIPWALYEIGTAAMGGAAVGDHQKVRAILLTPLEKGMPDYLVFIAGQLFHAALCYLGFFLAPQALIAAPVFLRHRLVKVASAILTIALIPLECAILLGLFDPPTALHRNVIFDLGIGPVLLKDTYVLGITRAWTMPKALFYLIAYIAVCGALCLTARALSDSRRLWRAGRHSDSNAVSFCADVALAASVIYLGTILLTGFHDRYLIPLLVFGVVWCVGGPMRELGNSVSAARVCAAWALMLVLGFFSVTATRDFMSFKRSLHEAHTYLLEELRVPPCKVDGGFEFNGRYCYDPEKSPKKPLSWWWVDEERYVVTLGPLPGYRTVQVFPFQRKLGPDGAVHILEPE
jgi:membrane-associated PAP2 superfamily phosphatase